MSSTISDGNENNEETSDGNRNKQEMEKHEGKHSEIDVTAFRSVIGELKELYNEFLVQIKVMQKDLLRTSKCDELESKVCSIFSIQIVNIHERKFQFLCS